MYDELIAWRRRQCLIFFGYSEAEVARLGDLSELTDERMNELIRLKNLDDAEKVNDEPKTVANLMTERSRAMSKEKMELIS